MISGDLSSQDIFSSAARSSLAAKAPLAARLRPRTLDEMVGQRHLLGPGAALRVLLEADKLSSAVLWGPPGSGKTSLARIVATMTRSTFVAMSAVSAGVRDVRAVLEEAKHRLGAHGEGTLLFLDEVHRFNRAQQDVLLEAVEEGLVVFVGATTENPFFELNAPLMSRSTLFRLEPLAREDLMELARRGLEAECAACDDEVAEAMVCSAGGDGRSLLATVEVAARLARARQTADAQRDPQYDAEHDPQRGAEHDPQRGAEHDRQGPWIVLRSDVEQAARSSVPRYGADEHYDIASALIKSVRGSDPDAGLYWLSRMLMAGEDPRFIARRLVILASEDVGMADPTALLVADAAARAVDLVGLPEASLNLAHAVVHLAAAPKSNRVTSALAAARADAERTANARAPVHLRSSNYQGAKLLSHGEGYLYPHDAPGSWVDQAYLPDEVAGAIYYQPSSQGREEQARVRLEDLRGRRSR